MSKSKKKAPTPPNTTQKAVAMDIGVVMDQGTVVMQFGTKSQMRFGPEAAINLGCLLIANAHKALEHIDAQQEGEHPLVQVPRIVIPGKA